MSADNTERSARRCNDARVLRVVAFFESLQPADLDRLAEVYAANASFKDPFNTVVGLPAIRAIFTHMFERLHQPRFVVSEAAVQGDSAHLVWAMHYRMGSAKSQPLTIQGATHLQFDAQGRVSMHRDYWDAAEELYEKLPLLGGLMRGLKRFFTA